VRRERGKLNMPSTVSRTLPKRKTDRESPRSQTEHTLKVAHSADEPLRRAINRIFVRDLFGVFTYDLSRPDQDLSRLALIYGDNGSGKTTILNLLFHLLSSEPGSGHRTYLANTPFAEFSVHFTDGTVVTAQKNKGILGSFDTTLVTDNRTTTAPWPTDPNRTTELSRGSKIDPLQRTFVAKLSALGLGLRFLRENRKDAARKVSRDAYLHRYYTESFGNTIAFADENDKHRSALQMAVDGLLAWARREAVSASNVGVENINTIYLDIVRRITSSSRRDAAKRKTSLTYLESQLEAQSRRSQAFSRFGLVPLLDTKELLATLAQSEPRDTDVLVRLLEPYHASVKARLDALQYLSEALAALTDTLNEFFTHKTASFDISRGLVVHTDAGDELSLNSLSSGEQQLLLLFCQVVTAVAPTTSIFIIDEPELSLNVKWQRNLVHALLRIAKDRSTQFVMATHSLELIGRYRRSVLRLGSSLS